MRLLELQPIAAARRNHGIEHATIHILSRMSPQVSMAGRSNSRGFFIYGNLDTESIRRAVGEAILRISSGESHLAIHPNCGTNLVTTAFLAAGATLIFSAGQNRHALDRIAAGLLGALLGVFAAQFVGTNLQEYVTTSADLDYVKVLSVQRKEIGRRVLHFINIQHSPTPIEP